MIFQSGRKRLQEMRQQGMSDYEIDKVSLGIIIRDVASHVFFWGVVGIIIVMVEWKPLLLLEIVVFVALSAFSGFRGVVGLFGDFLAFFQNISHAYLHRIVASFILIFELSYMDSWLTIPMPY